MKEGIYHGKITEAPLCGFARKQRSAKPKGTEFTMIGVACSRDVVNKGLNTKSTKKEKSTKI